MLTSFLTSPGGAGAIDRTPLLLPDRQQTLERQGSRARILIIDDDEGTRRTFAAALGLEGFQITTVSTGGEGIATARRVDFDLIVIDLRLMDISGIDVIRILREFWNGRFVLISAFLSVETAVNAMKLGAFDVIEKPVDVETLVALVREALKPSDHRAAPASANVPLRHRLAEDHPRSVVERWARYVMKASDISSDSEGDLRTLDDWAQHVAVSYSTLCETCRLLGLRPHDARDFARVLRALKAAFLHRCAPDVFLNVGDRRRIRTLSIRAGVDLRSQGSPMLIQEFLKLQSFVPRDHECVRLIQVFVADWFC